MSALPRAGGRLWTHGGAVRVVGNVLREARRASQNRLPRWVLYPHRILARGFSSVELQVGLNRRTDGTYSRLAWIRRARTSAQTEETESFLEPKLTVSVLCSQSSRTSRPSSPRTPLSFLSSPPPSRQRTLTRPRLRSSRQTRSSRNIRAKSPASWRRNSSLRSTRPGGCSSWRTC